MKANLSKIVTLGLLTVVTVATVFTVFQIFSAANSIPELGGSSHHEAKGETKGGHGEVAKAEHGGGGHGEPAKAEHGGGHGEAPKAEEHGGGHGEAKSEGGHGEAAKNEHGGGGGHGEGGGGHGAPAEGERKPGSVGLVSIDEVFVNVGSGVSVKSLGLKLELELFEESSRPMLDQKQSGIKHSIIEVSREQDVSRLTTVSGKLYFKECLVSRLNEFFHQPIIRDVHFSSFYLQ